MVTSYGSDDGDFPLFHFIFILLGIVVIGIFLGIAIFCHKHNNNQTPTVAEETFIEPTPIPDPVLEIEYTFPGNGYDEDQHSQKIMINESTLVRIFEIYNATCNKKECE